MLSLSRVTKTYAGVPALSDVALELRAGEVHALMGENGAGKSTLIRILAGVTHADFMEAWMMGDPVQLRSPADAAALGFRFLHQELNIVPQLSVAENIFLAHPTPRRFGWAVDWPEVNRIATEALARFGVTYIDPRTKVARLGMGDRMLIRLAALLVEEGPPARLFVLDEPTAALTHAESDRLFRVIRSLRGQGAAILYVSHRIDEVLDLADRITVLRDGRCAMTVHRTDTGKAGLIFAMTGRSLADQVPLRRRAPGAGVVARAAGVATDRLQGVSFDLREGEVLGVAGLENAGQSEVLRLFLGEAPLRAGQVELGGQPAPQSPGQAWARGCAIVPRDRRREGLAPGRSITANMLLPHLARLGSPPGLAQARRERRMAAGLARRVSLKAQGLGQAVRMLSGGNQQKVLFARAMAGQPRLLLLDDPTRGVDVGARAEIYDMIRAAGEEGCSVILTSTDLPEMLGLCDRILILRDGVQVGLVDSSGLDAAGLLGLIYGEGVA
jgi:ribose transport system ATP-binding protein